jgi:hypothetical protein
MARSLSKILWCTMVLLGIGGETVASEKPALETRIVACPKPYKGEMTVFLSDNSFQPWRVQRWSCSWGSNTMTSSQVIKFINANPPDLSLPRKWEEQCPKGTVGSVRFVEVPRGKKVESWSCTDDGGMRISLTQLVELLKNNVESQNLSGIGQRRSCPAPYLGSYQVQYINGTWNVLDSKCQTVGGSLLSKTALQTFLSRKTEHGVDEE